LYSWTFVHDAAFRIFGNLNLFNVYILNPLVVVISGLQDALWSGTRIFSNGEIANQLYTINSPIIWATLLISVASVLGAYRVFLKLEPNFAREL
jgi:hypothetical protein